MSDAPAYELLQLNAVDADDIATARSWAAEFTADYSSCAGAIVETLWPEYAIHDVDGWREILSAWVADERAAEAEAEAAQRARERAATTAEADQDSDAPRASLDAVTAAAERLDVRNVARDVCRRYGGEWDTDPGRNPPRFAAPWHRSHSSGTSCFADCDKFVDLKAGEHGGGAIKLVAVAEGYISVTETPRSEDFRNAVAKLRDLGYDDVPTVSAVGAGGGDGRRTQSRRGS